MQFVGAWLFFDGQVRICQFNDALKVRNKVQDSFKVVVT